MISNERSQQRENLEMSSVAQLVVGARMDAQSSPITRSVTSVLKWGLCPAIFPTGCQIAVLNGDPSKPNADVFLRVPGGYTIPAHSHSSAERMVLVQGRLTVTYKGAAAAISPPGVHAYGPASLLHETKCAGSKPCTLFIAFDGPMDATVFVGSLK